MFNYVRQDLTTVIKGILCHGCNCQIVMGRGVAMMIRKKFPMVYQAYLRDHRPGRHNLGKAHFVQVNSDIWVANLFTQEFYGADKRKYAEPKAIYNAMLAAVRKAQELDLPIYMPRIGAGLGGLDWESEVVPSIARACKEAGYNGTITVCDWP